MTPYTAAELRAIAAAAAAELAARGRESAAGAATIAAELAARARLYTLAGWLDELARRITRRRRWPLPPAAPDLSAEILPSVEPGPWAGPVTGRTRTPPRPIARTRDIPAELVEAPRFVPYEPGALTGWQRHLLDRLARINLGPAHRENGQNLANLLRVYAPHRTDAELAGSVLTVLDYAGDHAALTPGDRGAAFDRLIGALSMAAVELTALDREPA